MYRSKMERCAAAGTLVLVGCVVVLVTVRLGRSSLSDAPLANVQESPMTAVQLPFVASEMPSEEFPFNEPPALEVNAICVQGEVAHVAIDDRVVSYDVGIPEEPEFLGRTPKLYGSITDIVCSGDHIYAGIGRWIPPQNQSVGGEYEDAAVLAFDVSAPAAPELTDWVTLYAADLALDGTVLYAAAGEDGLHLLDISNAAHPVDAYSVPVKVALAVAVDGDYAYVSDKGDAESVPQEGGTPTPDLTSTPLETAAALQPPQLRIFDVSGWPGNDLQEIGVLERDTWADAVAVSGPYAYLASYWGLEIVDVSDRADPQLVNTTPVSGSMLSGIAAGASRLYLAEETHWSSPAVGLEVVEVAPAGRWRWEFVGSAPMWGGARAVAVAEPYVYLAAGDGLRIYDCQDAANPLLVADSGRTRGWMTDIAIHGQYGYVADGNRGLGVYDISSPLTPTNVLWEPIPSDLEVSDVAVDVAGGYAYVVSDERLVVFDISNPAAPVRIGSSEKLRPGVGREVDVIVRGDFAYVGMGYGMAVVDVSNPVTPSLIAEVDVAGSSAVLSEGDYVHLPGENGLQVFDVSNPASPTEVARIGPQWLVYGVRLAQYLYTMSSGQQVSSFSLANPASPTFVTSEDIGLGFYTRGLRVHGDMLYVLTEKEGVKIVDGSDPGAISVVGTVAEPGYAFGAAFSGSYAYVVHGDGLEVVDVSNPASPIVVYSEEGPG